MPRSAPTSAGPEDIACVVIGTAGHIDHGKTRLVEALTGMQADRLPDEMARGLTIDLGFARTRLSDGRVVGFIDVPGHERFVKNMVAGATGVDVALLVIAADDGVMPQTREHVQILELLGLSQAVVALTKIDLVDPELVELARQEVSEFLADSPLAAAPVVACSAVTGEGVDQVRTALEQAVSRVAPRGDTGAFRMPIQRVFSAKGHGTIVTGIPMHGQVGLGDTVTIQPAGLTGRVRGIQAYQMRRERAFAGHSTALNVSDVDYRRVHRGMVVTLPGVLAPSRHLSVWLRIVGGGEDLEVRDGFPVRFHTGTAEVMGEVALLEGGRLVPQDEALAQIVLEEPALAVPGDRFLVRRSSPVETIGGGVVLRLDERRLKRRRDWILADLRARKDVVHSPDAMVRHLLDTSPAGTIQPELVCAETGLTPQQTSALLQTLVAEGVAVELGAGQHAAARRLQDAIERIPGTLRAWAAEDPLAYSFPLPRLRRGVPLAPALFDRALGHLEEQGTVSVRTGGVRLTQGPTLPGPLKEAIEQVARAMRDAGYETPRPAQLAELLTADPEQVLRILEHLEQRGDLVRLASGVHLHREVVERAEQLLKDTIAASGEVDTNAFKNAVGASRKYVIPLLEHFDACGITVRDGNRRVLRTVRRSGG